MRREWAVVVRNLVREEYKNGDITLEKEASLAVCFLIQRGCSTRSPRACKTTTDELVWYNLSDLFLFPV